MGAVDRISYLPSDITDHILQYLPIRDAIRTGILSTHWRFKWILLPQLILDNFFIRSIPKVNGHSRFGHSRFGCISVNGSVDVAMVEYSNIVDNILLCHDGPIHKFVLHIPLWFSKDADITGWIHFVACKLIKEFTLIQYSAGHEREVPSLIFSCVEFNHLTHLTLMNWLLPSVPITFTGFLCLISLKFHLDDYDPGLVNKLGIIVSKCPLLENLNIGTFDEESCLTINAPKLQNLVVGGRFSGILLEDTKRIKMLSLDVHLECKDLMIEFFSRLPVVEKLILTDCFWNVDLDEPGLPREKLNNNITIKFRELKNLFLGGVNVCSQWDISSLCCFLNMAPKLQILEIMVVDKGNEHAANGGTVVKDCCLDHLKSATIKLVWLSSYDGFVLQLIKMLLSSSPLLEVMTIEATIDDFEKFNVARLELLRYPRASANAKIIINLEF